MAPGDAGIGLRDDVVEWACAVFVRNESAAIGGCLHALAQAASGLDLDLTVILNGNSDDSAAQAAAALRETGQPGRIWSIEEGCKSNAINQYLHRLRPAARTYFFVDGYAAVAPDALSRLAEALDRSPSAVAAAALPSTGRSAAQLRASMLRWPGLHGSLFALRGDFVDRMARAGLRLPVRMYRGDGLLSSMVMHDLDAADGGWDVGRVAMEPKATWRGPRLSPWRGSDWRRHFNRRVQQARGRLQWNVVKQAIYQHGFAGLPENADEATLRWVAEAPGRLPSLWRDPLGALALARMRRLDPPRELTPRLVEIVP